MITEERLNNILERTNAKFKVKAIELRNPFNGQLTGHYASYRDDTKQLIDTGINVEKMPFDIYTIGERLIKLSACGNVHLKNAYYNEENKSTHILCGTGHGPGAYMHIGKVKINKQMELVNYVDKRKAIMTIKPIINQNSRVIEIAAFPSSHPFCTTNLLPVENATDEQYNNTLNVIDEHFEQLKAIYTHMVKSPLSGEEIEFLVRNSFNTAGTKAKNEMIENIIKRLDKMKDKNALYLHLNICAHSPDCAQRNMDQIQKLLEKRP